MEARSPHSTDRALPLGTQEGPDALPRGRQAGKMSMRGVGSAAAPGFEDPGLRLPRPQEPKRSLSLREPPAWPA